MAIAEVALLVGCIEMMNVKVISVKAHITEIVLLKAVRAAANE
ncbi:MAG TPA: hypothetical protein ACFCUY_05625 [Xenococcaceae cyanobacterium]